jgi:hypothetical protein
LRSNPNPLASISRSEIARTSGRPVLDRVAKNRRQRADRAAALLPLVQQ